MFEDYAAKARKLIGISACKSYRRAMRLGVAAAIEHGPVLRRTNFRTIVDVGANRGQFALVARQLTPEAKIFSFEPLPEPAARFRAVFAGDERVALEEAAIGPDRRELTMHISRRDDSSSLLPITPLQNMVFPGTAEAGTRTVRVAPLDEFIEAEQIEAPALLKLDVQGYELQALKGCERQLEKFSCVYAECSFVELYDGQALADEVVAWLRNHALPLVDIYNLVRDRKNHAIQGDFLFSRTARRQIHGVHANL